MFVKDGKGLSLIKWAALLLVVACFAYGCSNSREQAAGAVRNLLNAAYAKNYEKVKQYADFDVMLDNSLKDQGMSANLDPQGRKKVIDDMVKTSCEMSKEEYEAGMKSLKVDVDKDGTRGQAVYSTPSRPNITLSLEKRKTGWVVTGIR